MTSCAKPVAAVNCTKCNNQMIKHGKASGNQRYRCKSCNITCMRQYRYKAYLHLTNTHIVNLLCEGCGIRSIARLLNMAAGTVMRRIKNIAIHSHAPTLPTGRDYEVDELRTYVGNKNNACWVVLAIDKQSGKVATFKVGKRTKATLQAVTDTLVLSRCKKINTDSLNIYKHLIPDTIHKVRRYGTNKIERKNPPCWCARVARSLIHSTRVRDGSGYRPLWLRPVQYERTARAAGKAIILINQL